MDGESDIAFYIGNDETMGMKTLKRIDYGFNEDEFSDKLGEEGKKTIMVEDTEEIMDIPAVYALENDYHTPNLTHEDDEKTITLNDISYNDSEMTVTVNGTINFKQDSDKALRIALYRPHYHELAKGDGNSLEGEYFSGIPVNFSIPFTLENRVGDNDGANLYFTIDNALFAIDMRTGEESQEPLPLLSRTGQDDEEYMDTVPLNGVKTNEDKTVYKLLSLGQPYWNWGIGHDEMATYEFVLGGKYKKLTFTLAEGKDTKVSTGAYDFYIFGDDFENIPDTDKFQGKPLFHKKLKGTDQPEIYTVDVTGVQTLTIQYDTNNISEMMGSDEGKQLDVLLVNPIVEK